MSIRRSSNVKLGETLIDKASKRCGSDAALARKMGIYPADVSNLRAGKRPLSPELAAEIAEIAGEDARQAVIDAVIERNEGSKKGHILKEILGKVLAGGAAAVLVFSSSVDSIYAMETIAKINLTVDNNIHRIYSRTRRALARLLAALRLRPCGGPSAATC
jgi:DNA-binding transcriptional regulator YdaS (Cro superfamily)